MTAAVAAVNSIKGVGGRFMAPDLHGGGRSGCGGGAAGAIVAEDNALAEL